MSRRLQFVLWVAQFAYMQFAIAATAQQIDDQPAAALQHSGLAAHGSLFLHQAVVPVCRPAS